MDEEVADFVALCKKEILIGGDYIKRIKNAPLYIKMTMSYDEANLSEIVGHVLMKIDKKARLDAAIEGAWNALIKDRQKLQQCGNFHPMLQDSEVEVERIYTHLHFYYLDVIEEIGDDEVLARVKLLIHPRVMAEKVRRDTDWAHQDMVYDIESAVEVLSAFGEPLTYEAVIKEVRSDNVSKFKLLCGGEEELRKLVEAIKLRQSSKSTKGKAKRSQT